MAQAERKLARSLYPGVRVDALVREGNRMLARSGRG